MLKLEEIKPNTFISGIESGQAVRVVATEPAGPDAISIYYKTAHGGPFERMLFRDDEPNLQIAVENRPWTFSASGADFQLVAEAYRINLAYLFDPMMAVHTSDVEPLPHQITAVYQAMLPRQPLRFVLADDPGAGKTIMAGLLIRELLMRADAQRVLVVAPGSLVERWQDEMRSKFGLDFTLFSRQLIEQSPSGNPFDDTDLLIARLDQLSRSDELQEKLQATNWDLIVVDEAHKLSASYFGDKIKTTQRFKLGQFLGATTRHFLLMTATPHNGKEEDFQLWLSLLDSDRFSGKPRGKTEPVDVTDLMRRLVKEEMLTFDGTKLFPERRAYTVNYPLSQLEDELYQAVTGYVRAEWVKADNLDDAKRKGTVGFALTTLQRRLASSPEAIFQSLHRRHNRLKQRMVEEQQRQRAGGLSEMPYPEIPDDLDDLNAEEQEKMEEKLVDQATAAQNIQQLQEEIALLGGLVEQAKAVLGSGRDRKWEELSKLLQDTPEMRDAAGWQRKLIIFTEHRDTLNYLMTRVQGLLGTPNADAIVTIHGSVSRENRRAAQERFRQDPTVRVMIATDAAGEGVNLQNANLMVNYDLPWNPNRLEQRFGRIHRIGQTEVCHLWNMVASQTREGDVFQRLFDKLEVERSALGGRVFDILGEVFEEKSLRELLIEAIRYGDDPERRAELFREVEGALDTNHLCTIIERNALAEEVMDPQRLFAVKEQMEKAEARKLQPYFIRSFFSQAFKKLEGELRPREPERWEITRVPAAIREHHKLHATRNKRNLTPVLAKYERVCFQKQQIRLLHRPGAPMATLLHPGHPLMQAVTSLVLEQHRATLTHGAILVDPNDMGLTPSVALMLDHSIKESGDPTQVVSRRVQFVSIGPDGQAANAGWAPHLDLEPITEQEKPLIQDILDAPWVAANLEQTALAYAANHLVPDHFHEVRTRRQQYVQKVLDAVHERLVKEINYQMDQLEKQKQKQKLATGKEMESAIQGTRNTIATLRARLDARTAQLNAMRDLASATPVVVGGALVIPAGLLLQRKGLAGWSADAAARKQIELVAMNAVMAAERALGHTVLDVSAEQCGWDVTSIPQTQPNGKAATVRHIEVKGRAIGATTITVTKNEILCALNQADKFILAIVLVDGQHHHGPYYVTNPFAQQPDWAESSRNLDLGALLARAQKP